MNKFVKVIKSKLILEVFAIVITAIFIYTIIMLFILHNIVDIEIFNIILFLSILAFGMTSIVIMFLLRKLLSPIDYLSKMILNIKDGDFSKRINIKREDEIGFLATEFNNLLDIIQNRIMSLSHRVQLKAEKLELINKELSDSINVASTIQNALLPDKSRFDSCADEYFVYYSPKDVVSGDIYLIRRINEFEYILLVIDCTGHGVSGAFITMLVKAIERELLIFIQDSQVISTSKILNIFNSRIKELLNQENINSKTVFDFGFDGAVLYINRKDNFAQYSGASIPLFISQNGKINRIKPDRQSIGYKKSISNYEYNEHYIDLTNRQTIYICTDGFIDQLGGKKGFPFAKKNFMKMIKKYQDEDLITQKELFLEELEKYQGKYEQTDDRTLIALSFNLT
jgi:serine phosphatase RsbU (regulator of sigma subunit)